ncbi:hypothetical protein V6Z11_D11G097800 [Gossypium hirsutum]
MTREKNFIDLKQRINEHNLRANNSKTIMKAFKKTNDIVIIMIFLKSSKNTTGTRCWTRTDRNRSKIHQLVLENLQLSKVISDRAIILLESRDLLLEIRNAENISLRKTFTEITPNNISKIEPKNTIHD